MKFPCKTLVPLPLCGALLLCPNAAAFAQDNQTAIKVKPGAEAIKDKDLWEKTGYIHPFRRMPRYILQDQKAIWTSPAHTARSDVKWWALFGAAAGALIATDKYTEKQ